MVRQPARRSAAFALASAVMGSNAPAIAQGVADFYRGRTITFLVGAGGEYDVLARLLARHIARHSSWSERKARL
jgi:tripartite-type tricarboxylate transporter receptor subunit TctC